jgi:chromosome segregation ATPase
VDFSTLFSELLKSPLMIAVVSVLGVKVMDYLSERSKGVREIQKTAEEKLWEQVKQLQVALDEERKERQKEIRELDRQKDMLIMDNAKLNADVGVLKAQNAQQAAELSVIKAERDGLREQIAKLQQKVDQ